MSLNKRIRATTLGDLLIRSAEKWPNQRAIVFPDSSLTYKELLIRAERRAKSLMGAGVQPGDHVGILAINMLEYVESLFAVALADGVAVLLNARYRCNELKYVVANADLRILLTTSRFHEHVDFCALLHETYPELKNAVNPTALDLEEAPFLRSIVLFESTGRDGFLANDTFSKFSESISQKQLTQRRIGASLRAPCLMMYTSGTTSQPKGCRLSHEAIVRNAAAENASFEMNEEDCIWDPLPMFHMAAILPLLAGMWSGATYLTDTFFDSQTALRQIYSEQPTILFPAFPAIMSDLIAEADFDARKLQRVRLINNVAPSERLRENMRTIPQATHISAYGMTEASGVCCHGSEDEDDEQRATTCGKPFDGVSMRVVSIDSDEELAPGLEGEIQVRGYSLFEGYYKAPERNAEAFTDDGWFRTGDLGTIDENGLVSFRGRLKDMLKIGGENVAALEIESFLIGHPAIKMVQVVGVPHPRLEEVAAAFLELQDGEECSVDEILDFCQGKISSFKIPRHVRFVEDWPMSATKIQKFQLRDQLAAELVEESVNMKAHAG